MIFDISKLEWKLTGWAPYSWRLGISVEMNCGIMPEISEIPIRIPGSIQMALKNSGVIPDWDEGLNYRQCDWIENRDWLLTTTLPDMPEGEPAQLVIEGLDGFGEIILNKKTVGHFSNAFITHHFDLTPFITPGRTHNLILAFYNPPRGLGQIGYTSKITEKKPRFNFGWDWCPHLVQQGIWDSIRIVTGHSGALDNLTLHLVDKTSLRLGGTLPFSEGQLTIALREKGQTQSLQTIQLSAADFLKDGCTITYDEAKPWLPNLSGARTVYELSCTLAIGQETIVKTFMTGFPDVTWKQNPGVPSHVDPWLCCIAGKPTFLQGINWTPIRTNFADVTEEQVFQRLEMYAAMGCNVLRVWGGAYLEKENFYTKCDELGLMVIQEFPLSSSGLDNFPPESPEEVQAFGEIAESYIRRRQSHPCLLAWTGGNELQWGLVKHREGVGIPVGTEHPMIAHFQDIATSMDPAHRFLPTSPTGPRGFAAEEYGENLHWEVHGPWAPLNDDLETTLEFWAKDDSLVRSETGCAGATSVELLKKYAGNLSPFPYSMDNMFWRREYWYNHFNMYERYSGKKLSDTSLEDFVEWSQDFQAKILGIEISACKRRFPHCGGVIIWMGHDACPSVLNTSVINYDGTPKKAVKTITELFHKDSVDIK